jgi:hypothetical protein
MQYYYRLLHVEYIRIIKLQEPRKGKTEIKINCRLNNYFNICFTVHFYDSTVFTPTNAQFDIYLE